VEFIGRLRTLEAADSVQWSRESGLAHSTGSIDIHFCHGKITLIVYESNFLSLKVGLHYLFFGLKNKYSVYKFEAAKPISQRMSIKDLLCFSKKLVRQG
jgi:hypothetical protein